MIMKKLLSYILGNKKLLIGMGVGLVMAVQLVMVVSTPVYAQDDANTNSPQPEVTAASAQQGTANAAANVKDPKTAPKAGEADPSGSNFMSQFVSWLGLLVIGLQGKILGLLTRALMWIIGYNDFVNAAAVRIGWTLTRDVANLFFVVILLAIAIGTILRVESYNFKRFLPKVILMAVLVNFSLLICGFIIDFAQVIMMTFAASFAGTVGEGQILAVLNIRDVLFAAQENTAGVQEVMSVAISVLFAIVMLALSIMVLLVFLVVVCMRVIFLWLLVAISPLAFVLSAFPQGERYAQQWWQEFTKYVIIGPVLAFFMWLTFAVATQSPGDNPGSIGSGSFGSVEEIASLDTNPDLINNPNATDSNWSLIQGGASSAGLLSSIIGISLLMGSLMITQQIGVAGASFAGSMFNRAKEGMLKPVDWSKGGFGLKKVAGLGAQWGIRKYINEPIGEHRLSPLLNPAAMWRGYQKRRESLYHAAGEKVEARAQDVIEGSRWLGGTGVSQDNLTKVENAEEAAYAKDFSFKHRDQMAEEGVKLIKGPNNAETRGLRRGLIRAAAQNGYIDDLMAPKDMRDEMIKYAKMRADTEVDPDEKRYLTELHKQMEAGNWNGIDQTHLFLENFIGRDENGQEIEAGINTIDSIQDIGMSINHPEYAGHAMFGKDGHMRMRRYTDKGDEKSFRSEALSEFAKVKGRGRIPTAPHAMFQFNEDGSIMLDKFGLEVMSSAYGGQGKTIAEHGQLRNLNQLLGGSMNRMNWKAGEENKVAEVRKDGLDNNMVALAAFLSIAGEEGAKFAWQKVGGKGTGAKGAVELTDMQFDVGAASPLSYSELVGLYKEKDLTATKANVQAKLASLGVASPATPTPSPSSTPRMSDFDADKHRRTREQVLAHEEAGVNFYDTQEYQNNAGGYENETDHRRHVAALNQTELDNVRGVQSAVGKPEGSDQRGVGLNFANPEIQKALGVNEKFEAAYFEGADKDNKVRFVVDQYTNQLMKDGGLTEDEVKEKAGKLEKALNSSPTLRIHNNASTANRRDAAMHEIAHARTRHLSEDQVNSIWDSVDPAQQAAITEDIKARYGKNIEEKQLREEAIAEMAGVGKGVYKVSNETRNAMGDFFVKARGKSVPEVETTQMQSELASSLRARGSQLKKGAATLKSGLSDLATDIMDPFADMGTWTADQFNSAANAAKQKIQGIKDVRTAKAFSGFVDSKQKMFEAKEYANRVQSSYTPRIKEREQQKQQNTTEANKLFAEAAVAERAGNAGEARRLTREGNKYVANNKQLDTEIASYQRDIEEARAKFTSASSASFKSYSSARKAGGLTTPEVKAQVVAAREAIASANPAVQQQAVETLQSSGVTPAQVVTATTEDINREGEILRAAQEVGGSDEVLDALNRINDSMNHTGDLLQRMTSSGAKPSAALDSVVESLRKARDTAASGGKIESSSVDRLLRDSNTTLRRMARDLKNNDNS